MDKDNLLNKIKRLRRESTETEESASVCEAIDVLIEVCENLLDSYQPERSKREDYKVNTINSYDAPKIEMTIDKDILTKYKWDSIDAVL